jgi:hypothetical protein
MATDKNSEPLSLLHTAEFIGLALISLAFGAVAFYRVLGVIGALHALGMIRSRNIPVGIEGQEPQYHLRGRTAVAVGLLLTVAFLALAWFAPEAACFFSQDQKCK